MRHLIRPLARRTAIAAVLGTIALALVPTAFGAVSYTHLTLPTKA